MNPRYNSETPRCSNSLKRLYMTVCKGIKTATPHNAPALRALVLLLPLLLGATACVHEYPEEGCTQTRTLRLEFNTGFELMEYDYTEPSRAGESRYSKYSEPQGEMTYIIHAYPLADGVVNPDKYESFEATQTVAGSYDYSTTLELDHGNYRLMAWAMFRVDGEYYYNAAHFGDVAVKTDPYTGDTDYRDAFAGVLDVSIGGEESDGDMVVKMYRPLAKYEFIADDLKEFIASEQKLNPGKQITLDDYYAVFSYPQFMPSEYNMFTEMPADAVQGITYRSDLTKFGDDEISLGFDYVFVNHMESSVMVRAAIYAKADDRVVAVTPMIQVPLLRSHDTLVRGKLLLIPSQDGVGIDPGFWGDIDLHAPLVEEK